MSASCPPSEPTLNPRYEILNEIARGGMGTVYRVRDVDLDRILALKWLSQADKATSSDAKSMMFARFLEEAQITAQLDHPAIVPVHDLGFADDGTPFYTMRYVQGQHLGTVIREIRKGTNGWNPQRGLTVLTRICQAVAYAHDRHIVHRDLKPRNIMVGKLGEVYVMDWGLARILGKEDHRDLRLAVSEETSHTDPSSIAAPLRTMDGAIVGTPAYMAPEQANGLIGEVDQRSDVYALGTILYQMLTGSPPYVSKGRQTTPMKVLRELSQGPPSAVTEVDRKAPSELVAICEKAMARRREDRYPSSLSLAEDLQAYLDHRVVGAFESGRLAAAKKWARRHRLWRWLGPTLGTVTAISLLAFANAHRLRAAAEEAAVRAQESEGNARLAQSQAIGLADFTIRELYDEVRNHGNLTTMDQVLAKVEGHLEAMPDPENQSPLKLLSFTKSRRAEVAAKRGDTAQAVALMEEAITLREHFMETQGNHHDPVELSYLANLHDNHGVLLKDSGHLQEAEKAFRKAMPIVERLVAERPDDTNYPNSLANFHNNLGNLQESRLALTEAAASYRRAIELRDQILEKRPDWKLVQFTKAAAQTNLARVLLDAGEIDSATRILTEAHQHMVKLTDEEPSNTLFLTGWALASRGLAALHTALGEDAATIRLCDEAVQRLEPHITADADNVRALTRFLGFQRLRALARHRMQAFSADDTTALESAFTRLAAILETGQGLAEARKEWALTGLTLSYYRAASSPVRALALTTEVADMLSQHLKHLTEEGSLRWLLLDGAVQLQAGKLCQQMGDTEEARRHFNGARARYDAINVPLPIQDQFRLAELHQWQGTPVPSLEKIDPRFVRPSSLQRREP